MGRRGLAGCPGTDDVSTPEGSLPATPMPYVGAMGSVNRRSEQRRRRGGWVTAAAAILLVEGGLGILYTPLLTGSDLGSLEPAGILIVGVAALSIVAGIGLLRLHGWARLAAGALSAVGLVFMDAPALIFAMSQGARLDFALPWPGIVGYLVVLFAVVRRWPAE